MILLPLPRVPRLALSLALCLGAGASAAAQAELPFGAGEVLTYRAVSGRFGTIGTGTLRVDGPDEVRGAAAYRLSFDFRGRVGPFRVDARTRSWVDPHGMASLRYQKRERSPLGSREEEVEIFPDERRWSSADGSAGETPTPEPLDELSFLFFLRSLPLRDGEEHTLGVHYDLARNPVLVRVLRRERTRVPAGEFATVVVEMRVRDERLSAKDGAMRIHLTDDAARIPVRLESSAPWVGPTYLLLESVRAGRLFAR